MKLACWGAVLISLSAACVKSDTVLCASGEACPVGTTCVSLTDNSTTCATQAQVDACASLAAGDLCDVGATAGSCIDGACIPIVCGDGRIDPGEACDDGNTLAGDGTCSADCLSNETCGNGIVDPIVIDASGSRPKEQCDDNNLRSGDGCSSTCLREAARWARIDDEIVALQGYAATYDSGRRRIVLFGGYTDPGYTSDVFEWTGQTWVRMDPAVKPQARTQHMLAYDAARRRVVLFGGNSGGFDFPFGDTWEWDGDQWTLRISMVSPPARSAAGMVYDGARKKIVLFGGWSGTTALDDVWEWDGTTWTDVTPTGGPPARYGHVMGYDPDRGTILIAGGSQRDTDGSLVPVLDTWELQNGSWRNTTTAPADLTGMSDQDARLSAMTYDFGQARFVAYGKATDASAPKMLAYASGVWTTVTATLPSRAEVQLVGDPASGDIYMYGGDNGGTATSTTYRVTGNTWTALPNNGFRPPARFFHGAAYDSKRGVVWIFGGEDSSSTATGELVSFDGATWRSPTTTGTPPSDRQLLGMAYDVKRDRVVVFGGSGTTSETHLFDPVTNTWSQPATAMAPPALAGPSMVYDAARERVVLFGGFSGATFQNDTWEWDGTTWTKVTTAMAPSPRGIATMAYDETTQRSVLFGGVLIGTTTSTAYDDVWTYDATGWTQVAASSPIAERIYQPLAYDRVAGTLTLFGGIAPGGAALDDTWTWDGTWHQLLIGAPPPPRGGQAAFSSPTGAGVMFHGGGPDFDTSATYVNETYRMRFENDAPREMCAVPMDNDNDGKVGCEDADCATSCENCGDGVCGTQETCRICPQDCTCTPACGDSFCDAPETQATCPGDCTP